MVTDTNQRFKLFLFYLCLFLKTHFSLGADTISSEHTISGESTIASARRVFELGFFRPGSSPHYYLGIWYLKDPTRKPVWVANRDRPVTLAAELTISDGNLVLFDKSNTAVWSTNVSSTSRSSRSVKAVLLDNGNLVLKDTPGPSKPLWESFDYPTHVWLPGAKFRYNKMTNASQVLTSWKNSEDPTPGLFSCELDPKDNTFMLLWSRTQKYWNSGTWSSSTFSNYPTKSFRYIYNYNFVNNTNESYYTYSIKEESPVISHLEIDVSGQVKIVNLVSPDTWTVFWSFPSQQCDVYGFCGAYGSCNENLLPHCSCPKRFKPKSPSDWNSKRDYSGGCIRDTKLQCEKINGSTIAKGNERDTFLEMHIMLLPENKRAVEAKSSAECKSKCLINCSCTAYAYDTIDCSIWTGELLNLVQLGADDSNRKTLFVRHAVSDHKRLLRNWKLYIVLSGCIAMFIFCIAGYVYYMRRKIVANKDGFRRNSQINRIVSSDESERHVSNLLLSSSGQFGEDEKRDINIPFVTLESILVATDNFSEANKLGEGGFGPVYKGLFPGEEEIAIKRLASGSTQGLEEFKNEVLLIAKLQHRNLVRLVGYCVEGDEKLLLYEYMPNKSLDTFIFDGQLCVLLNWEIRFNIILGIARGLIYLHRDSRLRIIHRDLKSSNVLLDEEMNPKVSDFGLAKIFGGKQIEASTNRVVGTYGYMSPEYALYGLFSEKSDVFSFGVVILEIISGRRNTRFSQSELAMSLPHYAWKLWKENKAVDLMDATLRETCNVNEFLRCVKVGLLCVEDDPNDRPTMSNAVSMLENEASSISSPKQPTFVLKTSVSNEGCSEQFSENALTNTINVGR
ncbi:G-type lectin S-receptor-like serine/threonine-protein kinase At4g03230 [Humulus lupulus]|uniref:G-type lectin S-receptor-like serine/threonine-protein kinase At4g03230 n=1 Tax=Humulus lupulus TaxID=3486 RepID=UPI002B408C68|nr:G-type lectin S-receptor-like serine/threonine-protein kinase At4g03230 [Humulus lupulus]